MLGLREFLKCFDIPSILADTLYYKQVQKLYLMRQQIQSKPNTTTVLSRYGPYEIYDDPIPVADFEKIFFDFSSKEAKHFQFEKLSLEQANEVMSLWKAELKCVHENDVKTITIVPSLVDFHSAISKTMSGFYKVVSNFTSLTSQEELLPYITQTKYDLVVDKNNFASIWPDIVEMEHQNNQYEFEIQNLLTNGFRKSMELIKVCVNINV